MAVIKQKTRKRLSKLLEKLIKKHGPEMTLALVTGIISALAAERSSKAAGKAAKTAKTARSAGKSKGGKPKKARKRVRPIKRAAA